MRRTQHTTTGRTCSTVIAAIAVLTAGCAPVNDPSAGMPVDEAVQLIDRAPRSERTTVELAEAFALNSRSTDVQREALRDEVVGRRVEWEIRVYEVGYADGRYTVTSQPIAVRNAEAVPLLRVQASVVPRTDNDHTLLRSVQTDDSIRLRGIVQEIRARTVVAMVPAVVVRSSASEVTSRGES